jgi:hypothetical protein
LAHGRLRLRTGERLDRLPAGDGHHHGDRLHPEKLGDARVRVDVDLREHPGPAGRLGQPLQHRGQLLARATPLGPEVDHHRDLHRALDHLGLKGGLGDIDDVAIGRGALPWRGGGPAGLRGGGLGSGFQRGEIDSPGQGGGQRRGLTWIRPCHISILARLPISHAHQVMTQKCPRMPRPM